MGETRVDLLHLLEDLRDAYPGALEETILVEIVANSLDSVARKISIACDPAAATVTIVDDGSGMLRRELARYHDIAASTKTRGQGIGFAGVGIKLGLLLCEDVVTETRRGKSHVATRWHLASRHKAPWKWVSPPGRVPERGTAVSLRVSNPLSPLLDAGFVEATLRRHFEALLAPEFDSILAAHYPSSMGFEVNERTLQRQPFRGDEVVPIEIRLARKRKPSASGVLFRNVSALPEDHRGVAISTLGKVIKRGWDWLGLTPTASDRIGGLIEVPALAECLTLNKADFIRTGARGTTYLAYRKALQEAVSERLAVWGDARDAAEDTRRRLARPVERDLERVLVEMADEFPLLAALVERREGGQRKLPIGLAGEDARGLVSASLVAAAEAPRLDIEGEPGVATSVAEIDERSLPREPTESDSSALALPGTRGPRKPARYGLAIQFESRDGEPDLARLIESTVWVNDAHPAYRRAVFTRSEGYHLALAVAMALAPLAVEPAQERGFVTSFLERWGDALNPARGRRRR